MSHGTISLEYDISRVQNTISTSKLVPIENENLSLDNKNGAMELGDTEQEIKDLDFLNIDSLYVGGVHLCTRRGSHTRCG